MGRFTDAIRLPSAKFPSIGTVVEGTVVNVFEGTVPTFDDKGRVNGILVDEDTGEAAQQVEVNLGLADGTRVLLHTHGAIFYAIGRNLAEIDAEDLDIGDQLRVEYTGDGEPTAKGRTAPKQYSATITKGATGARK